jgi:Nif-specific regulatory protein
LENVIPRLIVIAGSLKGTTFAMEGEALSLGRDTSSDVPLVEPSVSRRHCLIRRSADGFAVEDLDSFNGTFVNGVPVKEHALAHGDQLSVGDSVLIFVTREDGAEANPVSVVEEDLSARSTIQLQRRDALYLHPEKVLATLPASERVARHLNTLLKISRMVNAVQGFEELQQRLLEAVLEDIPAQRAAILLGDEAGGEFISAFGWDKSVGTARTIQVSRTIAGQVLREGVSLLSNDVLEGAEFAGAQSLVASRVRSLMCVPLEMGERVFGILYFDTPDPAVSFDEDHLQLLTAIAAIASVALENVKRLEHLKAENRALRDDSGIARNIIGESAPMRKVGELIKRVARHDSTVLIRGESGTGKELAARAIHAHSPRRDNGFVAINCATLSESLLESELFGHERGAFTGAVAQKKGKLEAAQRGTIFLDEIGELPFNIQAKLLRVLQEREFERVGSNRSIKIDVRVVAATNKDLEEAVAQGTFRKDLYYRLNVVSLSLPPLSERREDIPLLANYFISKYAAKCKRRVSGFSPEARACLSAYGWPGNIRELENAVERAVVLGTTDFIEVEDLPDAVIEGLQSSQLDDHKFYQAIVETKKRLILDALARADGNYTEAAKSLGIHPNNLHRLVRTLGLRDSTAK